MKKGTAAALITAMTLPILQRDRFGNVSATRRKPTPPTVEQIERRKAEAQAKRERKNAKRLKDARAQKGE
jgi:hypothetical protein